MEKIDLRYKRLNPIYCVKGFVENEPLCNYEFILRELINSSSYFLKLSKEKPYEAPPSEANGECDANTPFYKIDFKIAESNTIMEAKRQYSNQIYKMSDGVTCIGGSAREGSSAGILLNVALRHIDNTEEIDAILNKPSKYIRMEERKEERIDEAVINDLQTFFNVLRTDKNLFLFIPIELFYEDNPDDPIGGIREALQMDYGKALKYRENILPHRDSFLSCIYDSNLLVFKYDNEKLIFVEKILMENSSTYNYLRKTYDSVW